MGKRPIEPYVRAQSVALCIPIGSQYVKNLETAKGFEMLRTQRTHQI